MAGTFVTRQNEQEYGVDPTHRDDFYGKLQSGQTINGQTWTHNGQGWEVSPAGQPAPQPGVPVTGGPDYVAPAPAPPPPPPPAPTAQLGHTSTTPVAPSVAEGGQPPATIQGAYQSALLQRLNANPVVNSVQDDPALAAQSGAFRQAAARGEARQRNAAAERAAGTGTLESGGFDSTLQQIGNDRAFAESQHDSQLLGGAREQRMNELYQALALGGQQLDNDTKAQIQLELTKLEKEQNAASNALAGRELDIRQRGIDSQTQLGQGDLSLRDRLGSGQLGLGLLSTLLNDRQVNTGQGIQLGLGTAGLNQNALLGLLSQFGG